MKKRFNKKKTFILDGAMGSVLQDIGVKTVVPLWSAPVTIENPDVVTTIHKQYIEAGADIITTNTFRTFRYIYEKVKSKSNAYDTAVIACELAHAAVRDLGKDVLIAGSQAPLEQCYDPSLVPKDSVLREYHLEYAESLAEGGVDFVLIEAVNSIREAKIMAESVKSVNLDFIVSFVCNEGGLLSGESLQDAIDALEQYNPLGYGVNCCAPEIASKHVDTLVRTGRLSCIYANGKGEPGSDLGWQFKDDMSPKRYAAFAKEWSKAGISIIGGCCGTDPSYIKEIKKEIN